MRPPSRGIRSSAIELGLVLSLAVLALLGCGRDTSNKSFRGNAKPPAIAPDAPASLSVGTPAAPLLDYLERVTAGAKPEEALPMIVGVHGLGDGPENFGTLYAALPFKARVILPRGPRPWYGGYTWFDIDLPFSAKQEALTPGIGMAADRVAALTAALVQSKPTKGKPIVSGFSQGGMVSFAVATRHPALVAMAVPIGGALPEGLWPRKRAPSNAPRIRAFHGDIDELVPIDGALKTAARLKEKGFDVVLKTYKGVPHAIPPEMEADIFKIMKEAVQP